MAQVIIEMGSANTCRNDKAIIKDMIDAVVDIDSKKHDIRMKWQLWESFNAGENKRLEHSSFDFAYRYAVEKGYETTSSVFDQESLEFLLKYDPYFIKIACIPEMSYLVGEIPRKHLVYQSIPKATWEELNKLRFESHIVPLCCVRQYPATAKQYEKNFAIPCLHYGLSDHTVGLDMFKRYKPMIWERHIKLKDSTGLDAGPFASTPEELSEVL